MSVWRDKAERGSPGLIRLIVWLAHTVGRPVCRALLYPIVLYFVVTDGTARRASREFLGRALGRAARWRDVFMHMHHFGATLLDRVYLAGGEFGRFRLTIEGQERVRAAVSEGRGCVLLGSHLGSFDLLMLANQALSDQPVAVMMHVDPRSRLRQIAGIDDSRVQLIALGKPDSFMRAYEVLERGGVVAVLADRVDGGTPLRSLFFGQPAPFPIGPHVLAARAGAAVLTCFGLYEGGANYRIEFAPFDLRLPRGSRGAELQPAVDAYAQRLEEQARRFPYNWFNFFPYWTQR
jgi:predicted LPLAT superfamily acyltransferase